jgi:serine/threonine protein kinase/tetratricopeptide (TPR) repeat protein
VQEDDAITSNAELGLPLSPAVLDDSALDAAMMRNSVRQRLFGGPGEAYRLDRFVVLDRIGHGGMGVVYEAYDPKLERKVALKVLRPSTGEDGAVARQRMLGEARALAKLSHPHIVSVFEVGEHDEQVFIAMELVRGQTLRDYARRPDRTAHRIVEAYVQAARGLAAAHALGLVHRDFKPANALVGDDGRVRVLDFGLAQLHGGAQSVSEGTPASSISEGPGAAESPHPTSLTRTGMRVGTPAYMAPEQLDGAPVTPASDQYAWCVSLVEALTGLPPRPGIVRPDALAACPRSLRSILERGLAEDPERRWPSMTTLADRVEAIDRRGRRGVLALGVVGAGALVTALLVSSDSPCEALGDAWALPSHELAAPASLAASPELAAAATEAIDRYADAGGSAQAELCVAHHQQHTISAALFDRAMLCLERRRSAMIHLHERLPELDARAAVRVLEAVESLPAIEPCRDPARLLAERPPPEDPEVAAAADAIQQDLDQALILERLGDLSGSVQLALDADRRAVELPYRPIQARTALFLGISHRTRGELPEATTRVEDALWLAVAGADDELAALASAELVSTLALQGRGDLVKEQARHTEAAIERLGRHTRADFVLSDGLGILAHVEGRLQDARTHYTQAVAHAEQLPELPPSYLGSALDKLAQMHAALGERAQADAMLERALALKEASLGRLHPSVLVTRFHLASSIVGHGRYDEGITALDAVLADAVLSLGEDSALVGAIHGNLAVAHTQAQHGAKAIEHGERSVAVLRRSFGPDNPQLLTPMMNLAETYAASRPDRAVTLLEEALTLGRSTIGEGADVGAVLLTLAELELRTGDPKSALEHATEAVGMLERAFGQPVHEEVALGHRVVGEAHRALGDDEAADAAMRRFQASTPTPGE